MLHNESAYLHNQHLHLCFCLSVVLQLNLCSNYHSFVNLLPQRTYELILLLQLRLQYLVLLGKSFIVHH